MRRLRKFILWSILAMALIAGAIVVYAANPYDVSGVSLSPNGIGWTTNYGDRNYGFWAYGTRIEIGTQPSVKQTLDIGEHYYAKEHEDGSPLPIDHWVCEYPYGTCMHTFRDFTLTRYGYTTQFSNCLKHYNSGWIAYCADCGDMIGMLVYGHINTVSQIRYFPTDKDYFFICPWCNSLEQGKRPEHTCRDVSWNQYRVLYDANTGSAAYRGHTPASLHMYNNATMYDGEPVDLSRKLTTNGFWRTGYEFTGWNTEPNGSGRSFSDGQEILNLCDKDWRKDGAAGTIKLYAQWKQSTSILRIDPNGGTYGGLASVSEVSMPYGSSYDVRSRQLVPPAGALVSFVTNGAPAISPIRQGLHLLEWSTIYPFASKFNGNIYDFLERNGHVDTIQAVYARDSVTLPAPSWPGHAFSGWYYDSLFTIPAGAPGDRITPMSDVTLYAQWATLTLYSQDDYTSYGGSGAVDLSWVQADTNQKAYKLWQSCDLANWVQVTDANDMGTKSVAQDFGYTGNVQTVTIPYTGIYDLTAYGAQGGSYGSYAGGYGGQAYGRFWLRKGEVLTITTGGQNGYNGGGSMTSGGFSGGGGASTVTSSLQGLLITAGGGGGATSQGNGGSGGLSSNLRPDSISYGQDGMAGGGGGYTGGLAGEHVLHHHVESCYASNSGTYDCAWWYNADGRKAAWSAGDEAAALPGLFGNNGQQFLRYGSGSDLYPTPYEGTLTIFTEPVGVAMTAKDFYMRGGCGVYWGLTDSVTMYFVHDDGHVTSQTIDIAKLTPSSTETYIQNYDGNDDSKRVITQYNYDGSDGFTGNATLRPGHGYDTGGAEESYASRGTFTFHVPAGVKGVYVMTKLAFDHGSSDLGTWLNSKHIASMAYTYENEYTICGYEEGDIESSKPAYGGSSYVSAVAYSSSQVPGQRAGNGLVNLKSVSVGYSEAMYLNDVKAADLAAPDMVDKKKAVLDPMSATRVDVSWEQPADHGTTYYHKAQSFLIGSDNVLCESNITTNTLTSGIKGYWYVINGNPGTAAGPANGTFTAGRKATVSFTGGGAAQVKYLHITASDVAGNLSGTVHLKLSTDGNGDIPVDWPVKTQQMDISGDGIYKAAADRTWYVRADGRTPVELTSRGYLDGTARADYQVDRSVFEFLYGSSTSQDIWQVPYSSLVTDTTFATSGLSHGMEGDIPIDAAGQTSSSRILGARYLNTTAAFTVPESLHGKSVSVFPRAGAQTDRWSVKWSSRVEDMGHGLVLIADGKGPVYHGTEVFDQLKDEDLIDRRDGDILIDVTATDDLSGVREFSLTITNTDNGVIRTYEPEADGHIRITVTEDDFLFSGDFTVDITGTDNVGNASSEGHSATEFDLKASITRILAPHEPAFKSGESGILHISTWGYADRVTVEFPDGFVELDPTLDTEFVYTDGPQSYREDEAYQFMVPLYAPEGSDFKVKVTAYKGDKKIEKYPEFAVYSVAGPVLDEFRTRLK